MNKKVLLVTPSRTGLQWLAVLCTGMLMTACSVAPDLESVSPSKDVLPETAFHGRLASTVPDTTQLYKIDLYLSKGPSAAGTVRVELRDSAGHYIDSAALHVDNIQNNAWNTFRFHNLNTLQRGSKYRIYVKRSQRNVAGSEVYWWCSPLGVDAYPNGVNSARLLVKVDFTFKTYDGDAIEQQQTNHGYRFPLSKTSYIWQEFKADYPTVNLTSIDLNLFVGEATTGNLYVSIQSINGVDTLAKTTVAASALPVGVNWVTINLPATLYRYEMYRIFVRRSDPHNYPTGNYIIWRSSNHGVDAYPYGINDHYPNLTLDYAFKTYSSLSGLDQQQTISTHGYAIGSIDYRWQEFFPRNQ